MALADRKAEADRLRQQVAALEAAAGSSAKAAAERIATAEAAVAAQAASVGDLREQLAALQRTAGESAHAAVVRLAAAEGAAAKHRQDAEILKQEVADLNDLLAAAESKVDEQQDQIDGLDEQLALALTKKVEELEQYRSEFFGKLRQALGDRPDLRVEGDRFVFQSELLFASGSASLDPAGQAQLRQHGALEEIDRLPAANHELGAFGAVQQADGLREQLVLAGGDHSSIVLTRCSPPATAVLDTPKRCFNEAQCASLG